MKKKFSLDGYIVFKKRTLSEKLRLYAIVALLWIVFPICMQLYRVYIVEDTLYNSQPVTFVQSILSVPMSYYIFLLFYSFSNKSYNKEKLLTIVFLFVVGRILFECLDLFWEKLNLYVISGALLGGVILYLILLIPFKTSEKH